MRLNHAAPAPGLVLTTDFGKERTVKTTNSFDTFIAVAEDCPANAGTPPPETAAPTVAALTYRMISENPYAFTSDEVIFAVHARRKDIPEEERAAARAAFFARGQPCLRASALGKTYGWGIHADADGRVAVFGVETPEYEGFVSGQKTAADGQPVALTRAMRSKRA